MSHHPDLDAPPQWRSSSHCNNGNCVEVARLAGNLVGVRDNKNPQGPVLTFSTGEWAAFLRHIRGDR